MVGPAYYEDPELTDVPVIANNISDLAQVLTDEKLGGFNPFTCIAVPSTAGVAQVGSALVHAAAEAEDLLLFYYSGHGLLGPRRRELYLSLASTRSDQLAFTALPFDAVRDACLDSKATNRVVILDSCFSGRAIGETLSSVKEAVLGELEVSGTYTLTSSPANRTAVVLPGERHTAFTERLLDMLNAGSPAAGTMINLGDIYRHLHTRLRAEGLPEPQRCGVNNADLLGLVRNVHSAHASGDTSAANDTAEPEHAPGTDMTERLTHAERIANTIGDGLWRTRALAWVARAAADTFAPEHVERLIDQAEQAASAVGHAPAEALTAVVTALAALDPDRAERIANTPAGTETKGYVLAALTKAVAASDPERAESIAVTITSKYQRWRALSAVAVAVAATNPDRAERIARSITDKDFKWPALSAVAAAVAATNPDRAEHIAKSITVKHLRLKALSAVARAVAATDPDRAEHIAQAITSKDYRWPALSTTAAAVAATDPDRAERIAGDIAGEYNRWSPLLFTEPVAATSLAAALRTVAAAVAAVAPDRAERIAYATPHQSTTETVLAEVAKAVAATDPDRAERIANSISDKFTQVTVLAAVASTAAAAGDPDHAGSLIGQAKRAASTVKAHSRAEALTTVVTAAAAFDPDRAERMAYGISEKPTQERMLVALGKAVAATDPDRAEQIADVITDESSRTKVRAAVARAVAVTDPDRARRIANRASGGAKAEILYSVVLVLTDPK
ncbi:hypothetical protein SNL152K_6491 [Streptomyces sp. NL15-2K]|nr:hypothetical protein SNL152K_6491 [Streptomyces sp. NL15-2K]